MIARLTGTLAEIAGDSAVIDVGGVGYLVQLSGKTLSALGPVGSDITLLTELQVREDAWTLFGFSHVFVHGKRMMSIYARHSYGSQRSPPEKDRLTMRGMPFPNW